MNAALTEGSQRQPTMDPVKVEKLKEVQNATYEDMLQVLEEFGICNVERPTGFGKTRLFMRYAREHPHKKMLYVYDTEAVLSSIKHSYSTKNVDFISYTALSRIVHADENTRMILKNGYSIVVFDESHLLGGANVSDLADTVIPRLIKNGCYVLGGTATPKRTDLVDVTDRYFQLRTVYSYNLADAIADGLIEYPMFVTMVYSSKHLQDSIKKHWHNTRYVERLNQLDQAYMRRLGAPTIYRSKVEQLYTKIPSYMKFIVFYPTIKAMKENEAQLAQDFKEAFPDKEIVITPVSSDEEHYGNYDVLNSDECPDNHVDLITCVDMLNQGYHSPTLTGIIMNRATLSNIVYTQQLGRCLSVMSDIPAIVFDNVANCKLSPDRCLALIQDLREKQLGSFNSARNPERSVRKLAFLVTAEEVAFAEWYARIESTKNITQEDVDIAKRLYTRFSAPTSYIMKEYKIPEWLLKEELEASGQWEG